MLTGYGHIAALGSTDALKAANEVAIPIGEVGAQWPKDYRWANMHDPTMPAIASAINRLGSTGSVA